MSTPIPVCVSSTKHFPTKKSKLASLSQFFTLLCVSACLLLEVSLAATVGQIVWRDLDGNGIKDAKEPGVQKALVRLYIDHNGDGFPERKVAEARTDAKGNYLFTKVTPGTYSIGIDLLTLPSDLYELTTMDAGSDEAIDSDVDPHIVRSYPFVISRLGENFSDRGGIGILQGDGKVTYRGPTSKGNHLYTFQDLYMITSHPKLPKKEKHSHLELSSIWIKRYAIATRRQQMLAKKQGWLETQRKPFAPDGVNTSEYRGVISGVGESSFGYLEHNGFWSSGADFTKIIAHPTDVGPLTIGIYEGYRGTPARTLWRTTSNEEVLFPWLMTGMETYLQSGKKISPPNTNTLIYPTIASALENLDAWERRVVRSSFTEVFNLRYGLLTKTNSRTLDYLPKGSDKPKSIALRSSSILIAILQKVLVEQGFEKFEEAMDNLALVKFWPSSVELSAINFKKAINDATDGVYDSKFEKDWGFPLADKYEPISGTSTGPYVEKDVYQWCFTSDVDRDIPKGYGRMTNHMNEGMARFTSPINEVGYVDPNERGLILGRPLYYQNDSYSHIVAALYDLSWAHKVKNGYWAVTIDVAERFEELLIEGKPFGSYDGSSGGGYNRLGLNYLVKVTDGELNIEFPESLKPPAKIKYIGGFSLHYLGDDYTPATSFKTPEDRKKYNYNFGGDRLLTEPLSNYDSILPSYTDTNGSFWWRNADQTDRDGLGMSAAFHKYGLSKTQETGIAISDGKDATFTHKVKNGLWKVAVAVANVESQGGYALNAEGTEVDSFSLGYQKHGILTGYVTVKDGKLDIDVVSNKKRLVITSLEMDFISSKGATLSGFLVPDSTNTVTSDGRKNWFHQENAGPRWRERILGNDRVLTADESFGHAKNDYYQLKTTIKNLRPNVKYNIGVEYASPGAWAIKAGLKPTGLQGFSGKGFEFGGDRYLGLSSERVSATGRKISQVPVYRANLGVATADAKGKIEIYIDDPNNEGVNRDGSRTWFSRITYEIEDFQPISGLAFKAPTPENASIHLVKDDISVVVGANQDLASVSLFKDGALVSRKTRAPWQWGASDRRHPQLQNLAEGSHYFRAEVLAADGTAGLIDFTINVISLDYKPNPQTDLVKPSVLNTEAVDGRELWFATGNRPPLWKYRADNDIFSADESRYRRENDYIQLKTTLFGLAPSEAYEVFIEFASTGPWAIMGGLTQDTIEGFAPKSGMIGSNQHLGVDDPSGRVVKTTKKTLTGTPIYRASLGTAIANKSGRIEVFIDDPDNAGRKNSVDIYRAWFNGIFYKKVDGSYPDSSE